MPTRNHLRRWLIAAVILAVTGSVDLLHRAGVFAQFFDSSAPAVAQWHFPLQDAATMPAAMRAMVEGGRLASLRWPDFTDYRSSVRQFYEQNGYALAWVNGGKASPQALALIGMLEHADREGLAPGDYDGPQWQPRLERLRATDHPSAAEEESFDLALTVSAMRYASDRRLGRVNPRHRNCGIDTEQNRCELAELLRRAAHSQDVPSFFQTLDPPFAIYRRTLRALARYRRMLGKHAQPALAPLPRTIQPGEAYPDAPALAHRLRELGDLPKDLSFDTPPMYEHPLAEAVERFQRRHGLAANGRITPQTIAALDVPIEERVHQLQWMLERLRWLPRHYSRPPIVVNIPSFRLHALDRNLESAWTTNVVVGKAYQHRTPEFTGELRYLIFRPYWDVPNSIAREELLPKIEQNPAYLRENDYEIVAPGGQVLAEGQVTQEVLDQLRSGKLRIRQRPGDGNALGLVKFVFPNQHDVYMHSTPAGQLFAQPRRDFSHGCIRVERAEKLAAWCLRGKPGWSRERVRAAMHGSATVRVDLDRPIPVLIVYGTAIVSANGTVHFYDDIYGYDTELEQALARHHP